MYRPTEISASEPTVNDDFANGFHQGNGWLCTTNSAYYVCEDDTTGAAVWTLVSSGGGDTYEWDDWTPSFSFTPATPTAPSYVARYVQIGDVVWFYFDVEGSNDSGSVIDNMAMSPPVTIADTNSYPSFSVASNPSATTVPTTLQFGLIDGDSASSRRLYAIDLKVANGNSYRVTGQGFYEITT